MLRLASLLWRLRLRRVTAIESGLFEIQAGKLAGSDFRRETCRAARAVDPTKEFTGSFAVSVIPSKQFAVTLNSDLATCYLRLANLPNFALDRISRYEATLWRQVDQTLSALDNLDRREPQERSGLRGARGDEGTAAVLTFALWAMFYGFSH